MNPLNKGNNTSVHGKHLKNNFLSISYILMYVTGQNLQHNYRKDEYIDERLHSSVISIFNISR